MADTITMRKPALEVAALAAIGELEQDTGKRVSPEWVVCLQAAAKDMGRPTRDVSKLLDMPIEVGGALLYPLSYAALDWYSTVAFPHFGSNFKVLAYVLAHSFDVEHLRTLTGNKVIQRTVNVWLLTLRCSAATLRVAVDSFVPRDELVSIIIPEAHRAEESQTIEADPTDWGDTVAFLCRQYPGTEPLFWATKASVAYCEEMLIRAQNPIPEAERVSSVSFEARCRFSALVDHIRKEMQAP